MADNATTRIAHVVTSLEVGGLERVVVDLIRHLDPRRFESVVYCLVTDGALAAEIREVARGIFVMHKRPGRAFTLPLRLAHAFRTRGVDIVHAHNFGPLLYGSVAGRLAGNRPVVYTLHGPEAALRRDYRRLDRFGLVDRVVAVSDHVREVVLDTTRIDPARVSTIHNGIDVGAYSGGGGGVRERMRESLGLGPGQHAVGVVARLTHEKAHDRLLDAFAAVAGEREDVRLFLVGDGPLRSALEAKSRALGIAPLVSFLGTRGDVSALLRAFDLFVLPSRIEGLGITLLEAMAAGLGVVASAVGGIPEIVDGETGRLVPPDDAGALAGAMGWMLDHPAECAAMGGRGRARVESRFSLEAMVAGYERVYDSLRQPSRS